MQELVVLKDQQAKTSSLKVAEAFNREHKLVLRAIRNLECSNEFNRRNFVPIEYIDKNGEKQPAIEMTKDGFVFLAMGFTGKKAAEFKEAYIAASNKMDEFIQSGAQLIQVSGYTRRKAIISPKKTIVLSSEAKKEIGGVVKSVMQALLNEYFQPTLFEPHPKNIKLLDKYNK